MRTVVNHAPALKRPFFTYYILKIQTNMLFLKKNGLVNRGNDDGQARVYGPCRKGL